MMPTKSLESAATLTAEREDGERTVHHLAPGRSVLVGTSKDCGFRLQGKRVSSCHCLLSLEDGTLWVQDWASTSGTLINGEPVTAKVVVDPTAELCVGEYQISVSFLSSSPFGELRGHDTSDDDRHLSGEEKSADRSGVDEVERFGATAENMMWTQDELIGEGEFQPEALDTGSFEQETIALLRDEIDALQGMLAERDAQLAELSDGADRSSANRDVEKGEEDSGILLARLEELLEEAACGDERVVVLEEMLRAAEEANQAEQEERNQLEAWVGDIERRIIQRDDLRNAEVEGLRGRLEEAIAERERVQHQLQQAASLGDAAKCYEETLDRLQHQNKSLQDKLAEMAAERAVLTKRLESTANQHDDAMREERAAIAQERAVVSRLRCELSSKLSALEDSPKPVNQAAKDAATRLQALREHLREIHVEEQQENRGQQEATLTGRITRIWKRLEN